MHHHLGVLTILGRLGLALGLAGLVGLEREFAAQTAGLRTHALVALGSVLFTLVGTDIAGTDPTRVAAQVVTGVGFLGGGAILREGASVKGLTTATTLWVAAAIGLACGLGGYEAAGVATGAALVVLVLLREVERELLPVQRTRQLTLHVEDAGLATVLAAVRDVVDAPRTVSVVTSRPNVQAVTLRARLARNTDLTRLAERLLALDNVVAVELPN